MYGFWLCILCALGICSGGIAALRRSSNVVAEGGDCCNLTGITPKKLQARQERLSSEGFEPGVGSQCQHTAFSTMYRGKSLCPCFPLQSKGCTFVESSCVMPSICVRWMVCAGFWFRRSLSVALISVLGASSAVLSGLGCWVLPAKCARLQSISVNHTTVVWCAFCRESMFTGQHAIMSLCFKRVRGPHWMLVLLLVAVPFSGVQEN